MIEELDYKGYHIEIHQDEMPESPREWDNLGIMVCFHKNYDLGDKNDLTSKDFNSWNEVERYIKKNDGILIAPLYLYDHSGLRIKIGDFHGLLPQGHAEFDSGQVGFIYTTRKKVREEFSVKRITKKHLEKVQKILEDEVDTYDSFLSGAVVGYQITKDDEDIDSCWGYYIASDYSVEKLIDNEVKPIIDSIISTNIKEHNDKLKAQIKNNVNINYRKPVTL